jgi:hypothetical protein
MDGKLAVSATAAAAAALSSGMMAAAPPAEAANLSITPLNQVSGYVAFHAGFGHFVSQYAGTTKFQTGFTQLGGAAALNWWMSPTTSVQLDLYGNGISKSNGNGSTALGMAGHVAWAAPGNHEIGAMLSIGQTFGDRSSVLAIEGLWHGSNWSVYGQIGGKHGITFTSAVEPYVAVEGRWFLNANTAITFDATAASFNGDDAFTRFGAGIELKPGASPLAFFARAQISSVTWAGCCWHDTASEIKVGAKLMIGQGTLWQNNISGANKRDMNPWYGVFANAFELF